MRRIQNENKKKKERRNFGLAVEKVKNKMEDKLERDEEES